MQEIILKSNLIKKTLQRDSITIEEIEWLENLTIEQESKEDISEEELNNLNEDLKNIFSGISFRFINVNLKNCSKEIYNIVMRESTTEDIEVDGSREHLFELEKNEIKFSEELKKYIAGDQNEYQIFEYCKHIENIEIEPFIEVSDFELITKYAKIEDFIISIKNKKDLDTLKKIINNKDVKIKVCIDESIIKLIKDDIDSCDKVEEKILRINDVSKISIEDAKKLDGYKIYIQSRKDSIMQRKDVYSNEQYINIKEKINDVIQDIDPNASEFERFIEVYKKIANNVVYDNDELTDEPSKKIEAHNLIGGLFDGKCVCEGYSKILQQVLKTLKIDSKYIVGGTGNRRDTVHGWNQVKINEKWYNCDLTWDTPYIRENRPVENCLQSDKDFINHVPHVSDRQICNETFDIDKINKDMGFNIKLLESEEYLPEDLVELIQIIKKRTGTNLVIGINEKINQDECEFSIGKKLDNDKNIFWLQTRYILPKEDLVEFLQEFFKFNMVKSVRKEEVLDWINFESGMEIIIPANLKEHMLENGIDLQELINKDKSKSEIITKDKSESEIINGAMTKIDDNKWTKMKKYLLEIKNNIISIFENFRDKKNNEFGKKITDNKNWQLDYRVKDEIVIQEKSDLKTLNKVNEKEESER